MNPRDLLDQIVKRFGSLSSSQKVAVILAGIGFVAAVFYLNSLITKMSSAPLFTGLSQEDAGAIVQKLDGMSVTYTLSDKGSTVSVPKSEVYKIRANLAASGALPGNGTGFELFDKTKLGVTEFEQQVNYLRALQEELRRTIAQLDGVEQARVHLVIPQKSVFVEEQQKTAASVALKLMPLTTIKPEQVYGIVSLVCGAVEGIKAEDVHVIDMGGNVLSDQVASGGGAEAAVIKGNQDLQRAYERELERRITGVLTKIFGPDKAVAMVSADFDFNQKQTVTTIAYGEPAVVSQHTVTEGNGAAGASGVPGTGSNLVPTYPSGTTGDQTFSKQEVTTNYQVGQREEKVIQVPGKLKRLATSVVVDSNLTQANIKRIEDVVAGAIGYDAERGDQIQVASIAFDKAYQKKAEAEMAKIEVTAAKEAKRAGIITMVKQGIIGLVVVAFAFLILRWLANIKPPPPKIEEVIPQRIALQPQKVDERYVAVKETAEKKPDEVADVLRLWLTEEK
ncbi:MAG: flagellar basal-body MS-ring/collar protein FliF [Bacillota bacterium]